MLLLQTQHDVDAKILKSLELFVYFVAVIYAKHRFKTPVGAEAAANDLQLYKLLLAHEQIPVFKHISDAALSALRRHLGYLSEEWFPFALCFHQLQEHTKQNQASKLFLVYQKFSKIDMFPQKPVFQSISEDTKIENMGGKDQLWFFNFSALQLKTFTSTVFMHEMEQLQKFSKI